MALRGTSLPLKELSRHDANPHPRIAKPSAALLPYRAGSAAFISNSSKPASYMQTPGLISDGPPTPPPMKKARREVVLPSQEGKKGAVQYALYVANPKLHIQLCLLRELRKTDDSNWD
jgi:hypothetical protein